MALCRCSDDFFLSSRRRHTRCALVTGVQTCALPIWTIAARDRQRRLLRWATLLERNPHQIIGLLSPSWAGGDARGTMVDWPSAIDEFGRASCRDRVCQ